MKPPSRAFNLKECNSNRLLTLAEIMVRFKCELLVELICFLKGAESGGDMAATANDAIRLAGVGLHVEAERAALPADMIARCEGNLAIARRAFLDMEMPASLDRCALFEGCLKNSPTISDISYQAKAMIEVIQGELARNHFGFVPPDKAKIYKNMKSDWASVLERFPRVSLDVREASRCYAFRRNTACIFHAMRVAEVGLRQLAARFRPKIQLPRHIEESQWGEIIRALKAKLGEIKMEKRSKSRRKRLDFTAKAADKCDLMNTVWRRDVSHARQGKEYSDREASEAMTYTREFMELLAAKWNKNSGRFPDEIFAPPEDEPNI
jgi:hypothetical protein